MSRTTGFVLGALVVLGLTFSPLPSLAQETPAQQPDLIDTLPPGKRAVVVSFQERVKDYTKMREAIEAKMPKLAKESTPEQIVEHKTELEKRVREARAGAKPGQLFRPSIAAFIRATIKTEFKGRERKELRESVLEADTKGVPLRVNEVYPESKELVEMPPKLLLKLPQLPKQVRYRFVGRNMLLVDRENGLIVDYMLNALP
ncbi:MAG TPA: hypothetical protein VEZ40_08690 [Pyrinomonadaceae bacterium]|nr:hypothetical protein [Pyrinomonadaceae bacterium]